MSAITEREKDIVQKSFAQVVPIAETAAAIFYKKLFQLDPSLEKLFKGDMKDQGKKLMTMIGMAVKGLDDLGTLVPVVENLGKRHVGYGVKDEHYSKVGEALLDTLELGLGDEIWTDELEKAWTKVYTVLATTMQQAASA